MIQNYFKVALRNIWRHKFYSLINILGLAVGLGACMLILIYVTDELSYDRYHTNAERIFRIDGEGKLGDQIIVTAQAGAPVGPTSLAEFPEVERFLRFRSQGSFLVKHEDKHYQEEKLIFADSTFFKVFSISLLQGDPTTALAQPNTIIITYRIAKKYFGNDTPLGKTLTLDNKRNYQVTGVMDEIPANTHFDFDFMMSMASLDESRSDQWGNMNFNTYIILKEGTDAETFEKKLSAHFIGTYFAPEVEKYIGQTWDEFIESGNRFDYYLTPVTKIHLYSDSESELGPNSDIRYVLIFGLIGIFILLLAGINFINISTARAAIRSREIGVRKVVGAQRGNLITQFLGEGLIVSVLALLIAWGIVQIILPYFNALAGKEMILAQINAPKYYAAAVLITLTTGLLAGIYPAFFLSGFQPIAVLKSTLQHRGKNSYLRNGLVVFQFLITIFLVCGTLIVQRQLSFIQHRKLGYQRDHVIMLHDAYALGDNLKAFKEKLHTIPQVESATISSYLPVPSSNNTSSYFLGRNADMAQAVLLNNWYVDHDYVHTMGMELAAGRDFSTDFPSDSQAVLINESTAAFFQGEDPVGKEISNYDENDSLVAYKVIGVIKDFHFQSLRERVAPLALFLGESSGYISMRLNAEDVASFIHRLQDIWKTMAPGQPFTYSFMDDRFMQMYLAEQRFGRIIGTFSLLAIFVACIGMVGLATFIAEQRTKEIGVRKILGASVPGLIALLSKDFLRLVLIAFILAVPFAWYVMNRWLDNFAYRISIEWWVFAVAGIVAMIIALLTVSYQSVRAAVANPVTSLRSE
ncbi:MAG TPA: ABC transporter permease [Saprospiraceae bacterium]|nr:ABC transporter permease [Saprospiraceae bacterium]